MAANEILAAVATDTGTNLLTQAEYVADAQRLTGNQPGVARSKLVNKILRQTSLMSAGLAQFIADNQPDDITDDLTPAEIADALLAGLLANVPEAPPPPQGQCVLSLTGANLVLYPKNGNRIIINGVSCTIPAAGVSLAPPAVASTTYYIYAIATAGVVTSLEASATAHTPDATAGDNQGIEIKTGDATRSLVGMARTTAANAWVNSRAQRFVRSWFNDPKTEAGNALTAQVNSTTTSYIELNSSARAEFLSWLGEPVVVGSAGRMTNNSGAGDTSECSIGIDSAVARDTWSYVQIATGVSQGPAAGFLTISDLAEGYHYATLLGKAGGTGTTSWFGGATPGARNTISVKLG